MIAICFLSVLINPIPLFNLFLVCYLIRFNYFDSTVITFTSLLRVVKDAPDHIPDNIIG